MKKTRINNRRLGMVLVLAILLLPFFSIQLKAQDHYFSFRFCNIEEYGKNPMTLSPDSFSYQIKGATMIEQSFFGFKENPTLMSQDTFHIDSTFVNDSLVSLVNSGFKIYKAKLPVKFKSTQGLYSDSVNLMIVEGEYVDDRNGCKLYRTYYWHPI